MCLGLYKMATTKFLEEALSTNVDESEVNAIVGSLENQLISPDYALTPKNGVININQNQQCVTSRESSIIGQHKYNADQRSSSEVKFAVTSATFQSSSSNSIVSPVSNISQNNLTIYSKASDPISVLHSQNLVSHPLVNSITTNRLSNSALTLSNGRVGPLQTIVHSVSSGRVVGQEPKSIVMQPPLVIKQGPSTGQVGIQSGIVTVPMTVNSSMSGTIPNVMTLNKAGQNVVATSQNMAGTAQTTLIPNVQILNMRPNTPGVTAPKSVATVSPRVVIGAQQVVGARASAPGITLQTLQGLQPGSQGHLLLKTENGQYQLLRVGPAPSGGALAATAQALRLSTVPAHPGVQTISTSMVSAPQIQTQMQTPPVVAPTIVTSAPVQTGPTVVSQRPSDNTKEKCRNFLANLLDLSSKEPKSVERNVRKLIQELIDVQVEPEEFCDRLERLLNASPQPCLIGFLKKSLPLLRQSLVTKELVIEGINPPAAHLAFSNVPAPLQPGMNTNTIQMHKPGTIQKPTTSGAKPGTIAVLQNIPIQAQKINISKVTKTNTMTVNKTNFARNTMATPLNTILTPGRSLLKDKEKKPSNQFSSQPFVDDKMAGDDDINDVAAMGGVNLAEESQRILGSTDMIGTQIRSCKDEYLVPTNIIQSRVKAVLNKCGLDEPTTEVVNLINHAVHERLKTIIEKLAIIAQHRIDMVIKTDHRYDVTQDVKGQLKFLEELDRVDKKRREDSEREILLRVAKSRSKNEDPEQAKLKAKAKEMQRAELEELRQREANLTALQAIGPRKKQRLDGPGGAGDSAVLNGASQGGQTTQSGRSQLALRSRLKRINHRDVVFLMEQDRETAHSSMLYRNYLK